MERRTQLWKNEEGEEAQRLITKIYNALTCIFWSRKLSGFAIAEPVVELALYATDEWLSDVHENQMLNCGGDFSVSHKVKRLRSRTFTSMASWRRHMKHAAPKNMKAAILHVHMKQEMPWLQASEVVLDSWLMSIATTGLQLSPISNPLPSSMNSAPTGEKCSAVNLPPDSDLLPIPTVDSPPVPDSSTVHGSETSITLDKKKPHIKQSHQSAIHNAIEDQKAGHAHGLMRFLKPCTHEELHAQLTMVKAKLDEGWQQAQEYEEMADQRQKMVVREENERRQQKHCQQQHDDEIARGEQSPGGTKQNLKRHVLDMTAMKDNTAKRP
ncbi:hypothetical protein BDR04DRAFT_1152684 [Suillus decipiens]|nr:hypothetical protein BDR04DRAFT_1152684 [Suillus decipiens]